MKTLSLNGDWAVATGAFAQFYDSFAWETDAALTAFNFGVDQTFFDNLEAQYGQHSLLSENSVEWRDGNEKITLTTQVKLSSDSSERNSQIANLSTNDDTLTLSHATDGQTDVVLTWSSSSIELISGDQGVHISHSGNINFTDLSDIIGAVTTYDNFAEGFEEDQIHAIETVLDLGLGAVSFQDRGETLYAFLVANGSIAITSRDYTITLEGDFTHEDAVMFVTDITTNVEDISGLGTFFENEQFDRITLHDAAGDIILQARPEAANAEGSGISAVTLLGTTGADLRTIDSQFIDNLYATSFSADSGGGDDQLTYNVYGQFDQVYMDYTYDPITGTWSYGLAADQDILMVQSTIDGGTGHDVAYIQHAYSDEQSYTPVDYRGPIEVNFGSGVVVGHGVYADLTTFEIFRVNFENIEQIKTDWLGDVTVVGSIEDDEFAPAFINELGRYTLRFDGGTGHDTLDLSEIINANANETTPNAWRYGISAMDWQDLNWRWSAEGDWTVISMGSEELFRLKSVESIRFNDDVEYRLTDYLVTLPNAAARVGTNQDDSIVSGGENDVIFALSGNDTIQSNAGDDTINGGFGNDQITSGIGSDDISAGSGDDTIIAGDGDDVVDGANGHDDIKGDRGNDTITAGVGNDTVLGGDGADVLSGEAGADVLSGENGDDTLLGGDGSDTLIGGAGADILNGGDGNDQLSDMDGGGTLSGDAGDDIIQLFETLATNTTVDGGAGTDTLELRHLDYKTSYDETDQYWDIQSTAAGYTLNIGTAYDAISQTIFLSGIEKIHFSGDDIDTVENVHLWMNTERGDVFRLNHLEQGSIATFNMGSGDNYAEISKGRVTLNGGSGKDEVRVGTNDGVQTQLHATLNLSDGDNIVTVYSGQAHVTTGSGSDTIQAKNNHAQVHAATGQGSDSIITQAAEDTVFSGAGDDTVSTGAGSDIILNISGNDQIKTGTGSDRVTSYSGHTLVDDREDDLETNASTLDDIIITGFGNDTLYAGAGHDVLVSDLPGSNYYGSDHLIGMKGNDILFAGRGADTFVFREGDGNDTIGAIDMNDLSSATTPDEITFIADDFDTGMDKVHLQFGAGYVGRHLSDVIATSSAWSWLETETGMTLITQNGTLHFWGLSSTQLSDSDFEFIG